ncbi:MAG: histidine kinase [Oscillospiraceae bacterium]|nr:histidine kinase [Oscillospiraceae bacterium]
MFKNFNEFRNSYRVFFVKISLLFILIPLFSVGLFFFVNTYHTVKTFAEQTLNYYAVNVSNDIEQSLDIIDNACMNFISNPNFRQQLININNDLENDVKNNPRNSESEIDMIMNYQLFFNLAWNSNLIESVYLYISDEIYYSISRSRASLTQNKIKNMLDIAALDFSIPRERRLVAPDGDDPSIYYVANINDIYSFKTLGKLIFVVNGDRLLNPVSSLIQYKSPVVMLCDSDRTIMLHNDRTMIGKKIPDDLSNNISYNDITEARIDNAGYYVAAKSLDLYNVLFLIAVEKAEVFEGFNESMLQYAIILILISVGTITIAVIVASKEVSAPINEIVGVISNYYEHNFNIRLPTNRITEVNKLYRVFNDMMGEISHLVNDVYEKQLLLRESEFRLLQSQVNPHFMFNILEIISCEARLANNENIYKITTLLGELLRVNLNYQKNEKLTFREELKYINFYLDLQQIRFASRISPSIYIDDDSIYDSFIPKMCLQTIVENAVIHGIEKKRGNRSIDLFIWKDDGDIFISVVDDGAGFDVKAYEKELDGADMEHGGIGLINSSKRIKLLYGNEYGLYIESRIGRGSKVVINIPDDKHATSGL